MISVFTTHKWVCGYMGRFLCWECWLILQEILSCFLLPGYVWHIWCIKHAFLWVQPLICLLGTWAFLEDASLFHVLTEPEFQGGGSKLGRKEESSPCASLGSCHGCVLWSTYRDEDGNSHGRFWGENTTLCGCQWYKPGKRFIRRSLAVFRKWELTISKQKREWDLSISPGNHSCQKERCQIDVVTKPNFLEASEVTREGEKGQKRFNGNCICAASLRIKLKLCTLFRLEMNCRVYFCKISEVKLQF